MANFNMNKVILGGRLTETPELKATATSVPYVNFTIAIKRGYSKEGDAATDFIDCIAWRQRAEFLTKYFQKGSSVCIVGQIQTRSWTDQQGNKRYATDVVADEINFVDSKSDNGTAPAGEAQAPVWQDVTDDEDLPF